ncbi:MAG: alpha-2-macroglobulin family protein, partial [Desulfovibrio sp.]|nr:alpha-2-macroglobulin family protein [Desulfovibrio sp.]
MPRLWTDPSPKAAHALSCTLSFAYPVDKEPAENFVDLQALDPASGLRFGPYRLVWNDDRTEAQLYAPVVSLGEKSATARIRVAGMPAFTIEEDNRLSLTPQGGNGAVHEFSVQGRDSLFRVENLRLALVTDNNLGQEYELSLRTSLYIRPSALLGTSPAAASAQNPQAAGANAKPRPPQTPAGRSGQRPEASQKNPQSPLKIIQLPRFRDSEATAKPYNWSRAPVLTADVLNRGRVLTPESLQADDEPVSSLRFRIRPDEGGYIYVHLPADLASASGITLGKPVRQVLKAEKPAPRLDFLQPGNILALGGQRTLDIHSTGLTAVRWEVCRVRSPFLALLSSDDEDGDAFASPPLYGSLSIDRVSVVSRGELRPARSSAGAPQFSVLDLSPFLQDKNGDTRGLMQINLRGMDGDQEVASAQRLVLVTDLGLMVKKSALGEYDVFVSLLSGGPAGDTLVQILGANGLPVAEARADAQGHTRLPNLAGLEREKRPVAVVAARESDAGTDLAWLPLNDRARMVDYSAFPTAGRVTPEEGLNAYVFAQRGMFRPGETLRFGCIVRRADWKELPDDLLLQAVLTNPAGTEVMRRAFRVGADGPADIEWTSREESPTGHYRLDVRTTGSAKPGDQGIVLGTTRVRVEEFQPDTLELKARFEPVQDKGWLPLPEADAAVRAVVTLKNLYGTPAADRRIKTVMQVRPADLRFPGYADYVFHDASPYRGETRETPLPDVRTGPDGTAAVPLPPEELRAGTVLCSLLLEGFEPGGGRAVGLRKDILLSPLKTILGYKGTGAGVNLHFIPKGREAGLEFLALNPALEKTDPGPLTFVVYARRYVTSLVTDTRGALRFDETPVDKEYARSTQSTDADGLLRWNIPTQTPGEYLLTVFDRGGAVAASVPFTVAGDNLRAGTETVPGILRAHIDKEDYDAGETIQVYLSAPYDGAGLITVERDGVAAFRWFRAEAGDSVQSVTIPEGFEGRGYVNVSLVRDPASPDIYMAPHAYALVPFTAAVRGRDMGLALRAPERVRPGDVLSVAVSAREPGKALVFAVDEGVLQLTGFVAPSPLDYLLKDRALSVQSLQAFDLLMPDHARLAGRIPGFGGDAASGGGRFLNPFKRRGEPPLTSWALVDVGPQETRVEIPVPTYYNGRVRITAVGSSPRTAGNALARTTVRGDLVITPQMPLTV